MQGSLQGRRGRQQWGNMNARRGSCRKKTNVGAAGGQSQPTPHATPRRQRGSHNGAPVTSSVQAWGAPLCTPALSSSGHGQANTSTGRAPNGGEGRGSWHSRGVEHVCIVKTRREGGERGRLGRASCELPWRARGPRQVQLPGMERRKQRDERRWGRHAGAAAAPVAAAQGRACCELRMHYVGVQATGRSASTAPP